MANIQLNENPYKINSNNTVISNTNANIQYVLGDDEPDQSTIWKSIPINDFLLFYVNGFIKYIPPFTNSPTEITLDIRTF